jgi:hypothetical protein
MKNALGTGALLVLIATTAGCTFLNIFEDVGSDPHPPTVEVTQLVIYVAPVEPPTASITAGAAAPQKGRTIFWDSGGFTLSPGQLFQIGIAYTDAGGDILKFTLHDRDGALQTEFAPTDQTYFSGTSGFALVPESGNEIAGIVGPHRLQLWAEDSHGSRSEYVEFVITLTP